jgi:ATP-dependent RNA helicase RhlE
VNYDIPNVPETYVHRIGRTGRAGASGSAVSFVGEDEHGSLADIQRLIKRKIKVVGDMVRAPAGTHGTGGHRPAVQTAQAPRQITTGGAHGRQSPASSAGHHAPKPRAHQHPKPHVSVKPAGWVPPKPATGHGHHKPTGRPQPRGEAVGQGPQPYAPRRSGGFKPGGGGGRKPWGPPKSGGHRRGGSPSHGGRARFGH